MAASGYTPIILFNSTTTGNTPTTSNLAVGELAINVTDGKLFFNQSGTIKVLANATYATSVSTISFGTTGLTPSTATSGVVTVAGTLAVANGGTGQTTASAGFNALSPITTTGDLIIGNGTNSATRLAIGANTYVLTSNGTTASWQASSGGGGSAATPTALGTVYGAMDTGAYGQAFIGYQAGNGNTTSAANNTAMGNAALYTNTGAAHNSAFGFKALYFTATGGDSNSAFGSAAMYSNTTGTNNIGIGRQALYSNTTGSSATAVGYQAMYNSNNAYQCTAIGYQAMYTQSGLGGGGNDNTAVGHKALYAMNGTSGGISQGNTAFGTLAGSALTGAATNANSCFGAYAGDNITSGSNNILFGYAARPSAGTDSNEIVIGYNSSGKGGSTGYINPGSGGVYQGNNSAAWSVASDFRLKKNIVDNNVGLDKVIQIQVRNFEYRTEDEVTDLPKNQAIKKQGVQLGVIAQELQQVLPDCVKQESTGVLAVDSTDIMYHLINAIKELNAEIQALKSKVGI